MPLEHLRSDAIRIPENSALPSLRLFGPFDLGFVSRAVCILGNHFLLRFNSTVFFDLDVLSSRYLAVAPGC